MSKLDAFTSETLIEKTPGICGGDARIRGTRIPVWSIINSWRLGVSKEELRNYFGADLTSADIEAAFRYFHDHQEEIEEDIRLNEEA